MDTKTQKNEISDVQRIVNNATSLLARLDKIILGADATCRDVARVYQKSINNTLSNLSSAPELSVHAAAKHINSLSDSVSNLESAASRTKDFRDKFDDKLSD